MTSFWTSFFSSVGWDNNPNFTGGPRSSLPFHSTQPCACHMGLGVPGLSPVGSMESGEALGPPCSLCLLPVSDSKVSSLLQGVRQIKRHWLLLTKGKQVLLSWDPSLTTLKLWANHVIYFPVPKKNPPLQKPQTGPSILVYSSRLCWVFASPAKPLFLTPAGLRESSVNFTSCQWSPFRKIGSFDTILDKP